MSVRTLPHILILRLGAAAGITGFCRLLKSAMIPQAIRKRYPVVDRVDSVGIFWAPADLDRAHSPYHYDTRIFAQLPRLPGGHPPLIQK